MPAASASSVSAGTPSSSGVPATSGHAPTDAPTPSGKILSREQLLKLRGEARERGLRLTQCHGCFDIVHPGHIRHLRFAKSQGDLLLVSITGDAEMKKGLGRPLIPEELRAENLAALDIVDWVYIEPAPTAEALLAEVRPDIYIKGREYENNDDPRFRAEREAVEAGGGRVVFSSGDVVFSSTALIAAMDQSIAPYHARLMQLAQDPSLSQSRMTSTIAQFRGKRVIVFGETILDTYVLCDRPEVAGESPVLSLRPVEWRRYDGGAAVVARHAAALGARPILVTALPENDQSRELVKRLASEGVEVRSIAMEQPIPEKQRFLVGAQKVMKLDLVEPITLDVAAREAFVALGERTAGEAGGVDAAIMTDFGLGLFTSRSVSDLCQRVRPLAGIFAGDVSGKRSNLLAMQGLDLLCPSESELREALRMHAEGLPAVVWKALEQTRARASVVTLGADGLIAFERMATTLADTPWPSRLRAEHVPALAPLAIDPLGCGDALLTVASLALASGASLLTASFLGACAASVHVQRLGNMALSASDLRQAATRVQAARLTYAGADAIEACTPASRFGLRHAS
ncbi:MAG: PfkB family carbohydrate kinase [Planctomycetota bacterium]|nr:PfkB family carbohydrate kinase [Planctomycetota bacterium]